MTELWLPSCCALFAGGLCSERGKHRVFDSLFDIALAMGAMMRGIAAAHGREIIDWAPGAQTGMASSLFSGLSIDLPVRDVFEDSLSGKLLDKIAVRFLVPLIDIPWDSIETVFSRLNNRLVSAYFVQFIDPWLEWIALNISSDRHKWPRVCNFGRVVRNAATHGGTINIKSTTAPVVSWYSLQYDYRSYGKSIIGSDISCGDLLILMFEVSDELDKIGAPFSPS
jgi:hypothetical protein